VLELVEARSERRRELVLHRHEPSAEDLVREVDLGDVRVRDARELDDALVEQVADRAHGVRVRHARVGAVELVEADRVDAEPAGRGLHGLLQVLGSAVLGPRAVARSQVAALRGDEHVGRVAAPRAERAGDELLVVADLVGVEVVRVGGVDEGHAGLEGGVDGRDRPGLVGPPLDRHRHAAESDGADRARADGSLLHGASFRCEVACSR
jgi:hypothetical protein